jgi:hypothetical protein
MRVEGYEPGDKIHYKTGSPNGISHDSQATVTETQPRTNQLSVRIDSTRDLVSYNPGDRPAQTRESRIFQEGTREMAEGERIRFTRYDKEAGVRSGDLGTVTRLGQDNCMTVKLDSGKITELSPEKTKHLDHGYTIYALKNVRAERVIATGDGLTQQAFQGASARADLNLYTGSPAPTQEFSAARELTSPEIASLPSSMTLASSSRGQYTKHQKSSARGCCANLSPMEKQSQQPFCNTNCWDRASGTLACINVLLRNTARGSAR